MRKKIIIKKISLLLVMLNILLLTGCWNYTEIDDQINVAGFAVDKGEEGKKYHLCAEIVNVGKGKQTEISTEIIEADGDTIIESIRDMISVSSKKLYFGHCKALIIGEDIAKEGIADILDLVIRDHETRVTIDILVSKGCTAKSVLSTKGINNPIISYEADDMLRTGEKSLAKSPRVQVYQVLDNLQTVGVSNVIPAFVVTKVEDYDTFKSSGVGVFKEDKIVGYLGQKETETLSLIKNEIKSGVLAIKTDEQKNSFIAFEVIDNKTKIKPKLNGDKLAVDIISNTQVNMLEVETRFDYVKDKEREKIKRQLEKKIEEDISQLVEKVQTEFGSDIFGIGMLIHKNYPNLWEKYEDNWDDTFKNLDINVHSNVVIKGSGINNKTIEFGEQK